MSAQNDIDALEELGVPINLKWHKRAGNGVILCALAYFWNHLGDTGGIQRIDVLTTAVIALLGLCIRLWCLVEFQTQLNLYLFDSANKKGEEKK